MENISKNILTTLYAVWYYALTMNNVQTKIAQLQEKGWTLAALADELGVTPNAVEKWKSGDRHPNNTKLILTFLDQLTERKHIPKKRRYQKGSRLHSVK